MKGITGDEPPAISGDEAMHFRRAYAYFLLSNYDSQIAEALASHSSEATRKVANGEPLFGTQSLLLGPCHLSAACTNEKGSPGHVRNALSQTIQK